MVNKSKILFWNARALQNKAFYAVMFIYAFLFLFLPAHFGSDVYYSWVIFFILGVMVLSIFSATMNNTRAPLIVLGVSSFSPISFMIVSGQLYYLHTGSVFYYAHAIIAFLLAIISLREAYSFKLEKATVDKMFRRVDSSSYVRDPRRDFLILSPWRKGGSWFVRGFFRNVLIISLFLFSFFAPLQDATELRPNAGAGQLIFGSMIMIILSFITRPVLVQLFIELRIICAKQKDLRASS